MTDFFEMFAPGTKHWREQQELENTLLIEVPSGDPEHPGSTVDLDARTAIIVMPVEGIDAREQRARRPRRRRRTRE